MAGTTAEERVIVPTLGASRFAPGNPLATPSARDAWLTGRWRAYTRRAGRLLETPVQHEPWPLQEARVERLGIPRVLRGG